jgi:hypothetical protein
LRISYSILGKQEENVNKKLYVAWMVALFLVVAGLLAAVSLQAQARELCCIAGTYEGFQLNYARPNCPIPEKQNFTMVIKQMRPCAADIGGTITDSSGMVSNWTGILSRGLRGCCVLEGSFLTPSGNTVTFKGTICKKKPLGKWQAKGTWVELRSSDPCKGGGTWEMTQI